MFKLNNSKGLSTIIQKYNFNNLGYKTTKMPKPNTGAVTNRQTQRIEISHLLKNEYLKKDCIISGLLTWNNESSVSIRSVYTDAEKYIHLEYTSTIHSTGIKTAYDYKIQLIEKKSNLGKGKVLFFRCPQNGKLCRILYSCYGSGIFKSRTAFKKRIYYGLQLSSKAQKGANRLEELENRIETFKKPVKSHYKGKETRTIKQYYKLFDAKEKAEYQSGLELFKYLQSF